MSARRGVRRTATGSLKSTVTAIASPAMKTPAGPLAAPPTVRPTTDGATTSTPSPSTVKSGSAAIAWAPRPSAASFPAASRIVPPLSLSDEDATLTPSESSSAADTR